MFTGKLRSKYVSRRSSWNDESVGMIGRLDCRYCETGTPNSSSLSPASSSCLQSPSSFSVNSPSPPPTTADFSEFLQVMDRSHCLCAVTDDEIIVTRIFLISAHGSSIMSQFCTATAVLLLFEWDFSFYTHLFFNLPTYCDDAMHASLPSMENWSCRWLYRAVDGCCIPTFDFGWILARFVVYSNSLCLVFFLSLFLSLFLCFFSSARMFFLTLAGFHHFVCPRLF